MVMIQRPGQPLVVLGNRDIQISQPIHGGFAPTDVSGLAVWFKADVGLYQSSGGSAAVSAGDVVGEWQDQSGNSKHATQTTTANKPTLRFDSSNPLVRFDGSDLLVTPSFALTRFTAFIVMKAADRTIDLLVEHSVDVNIHDGFFMAIGNTVSGAGVRINGSGTTESTLAPPSNDWWNDSAWNIAAARNGASGTGIYKNSKTAGASNATDKGNLTSQALHIGARSGVALALVGDIKEIIIYDNQLSVANFDAVMDYLADRHGITLS